MPAELASEVIELVTSAVDKFLATDNFEKASQTLKDSLECVPASLVASCAHTGGRSLACDAWKRTQYKASCVSQARTLSRFRARSRKFGPSWQVAIGEGFSFSVTYNSHSLLYLLYGEKLGILVFKV